MQARSRVVACLSAAVAATLCGTSGDTAHGRDLIWDANGPSDPKGADGSGSWDHGSSNWLEGDTTTGTNTTWSSSPTPDSATFGNLTSAPVGGVTPHNIDFGANLTVQNLTLGTAADGGIYNFSDFGGSLTIAGDVTKASPGGQSQFLLFNGPLTLTAGDHVFAINDTPDDVPELSVNGVLAGAGGLTLDNGPSYEAYGTLVFNGDNTYAGATNINKGRLVVTTSGALGSTAAGTTIGEMGTLSFGGAKTSASGLTVAEAITITRDTYAGGQFGQYTAAIENRGGNNMISGPLVIDSADGRVASYGGNLTISSDITQAVGGPNATLSITGDFGGVVTLTGNNAGLLGGITIGNAATASVSSHANLGGVDAPITFAGDGYLRVNGGFMTSFGSHPINNATFTGGLDVPTGQAFTIDQSLGDSATEVGAIGKRGGGTLNLASTINLRGGATWWDAGTVNVSAPVTLHSLHLRSPEVNIGDGGSITVAGGAAGSRWNSIGADSTGTGGAPDRAVINITGNGQLVQTSVEDFNVSDNPNTEGTINLRDDGVLTTNHLTFVGKSAGATGTIDQSGGTFNINRDGNFGLVLGSRDGTGVYRLSGGTLNSVGEFYVGQGGNGTFGTGFFTMTGGTVNQNDWFVVGREGGVGTMDMSAGTFNKAGPGNTSIGERGTGASVMTLRGDATFNADTGEFFVGNESGSNGTLNVRDDATLTTRNWFVVGRFDAAGTLNLSGGTITKTGDGVDNNANGTVDEHGEDGHTEFDVGGGASSTVTISGTGVLNVNSGELRIGQGGGANATLNIRDDAAVNTNFWTVIGRGGGTGALDMSGGALTKNGGGNLIVAAGGNSNGTFAQSGGTVTNTTSETWINEGGVSGLYDLSGGTASLARIDVGRNGSGNAELRVRGAGAMTATTVRLGDSGGVNALVTLSGGSLTSASIEPGASTGSKAFNFTGGVLTTGAYALATPLDNGGTGTLAPGGLGGVGTTAITAGYLQGAGGTLAIDIASLLSFDAVTAGDDSVINGLVSVDVLDGYGLVPGSIYDVLVTTGGLTGSPALGGPDGGLFTSSIVGGNTLRLTAVPEPGGLSLLAVAGAAVLRRRRPRRGPGEAGGAAVA